MPPWRSADRALAHAGLATAGAAPAARLPPRLAAEIYRAAPPPVNDPLSPGGSAGRYRTKCADLADAVDAADSVSPGQEEARWSHPLPGAGHQFTGIADDVLASLVERTVRFLTTTGTD